MIQTAPREVMRMVSPMRAGADNVNRRKSMKPMSVRVMVSRS